LRFTAYAPVLVVLLFSHVLLSGVLYMGFCLVAASLPYCTSATQVVIQEQLHQRSLRLSLSLKEDIRSISSTPLGFHVA
jgi:hypothetical protein